MGGHGPGRIWRVGPSSIRSMADSEAASNSRPWVAFIIRSALVCLETRAARGWRLKELTPRRLQKAGAVLPFQQAGPQWWRNGKIARRRRVTCDRPAMCVLGLGCATKNDHTPHHPSGFWSYLGYTGTTRTWRSRWWYRQEKILKPETLPEPESEVTTVCNFLRSATGGARARAAPRRSPGQVFAEVSRCAMAHARQRS